MSTARPQKTDPVSSGEIRTIDLERAAEVQRRHLVLAQLLIELGYDGVLLQKPSNFSWLTCGGDNTRRGTPETTAAIYVTQDSRVVLCSNVDSGQLFDRELMGLGFQLKERPWSEPKEKLLRDVCRGRRTACDNGFPNTENIEAALSIFRLPLTEYDQIRVKTLATGVTHAVEAAARTCEQGQTEAEVAGQLAHRLLKRNIQPARLQVMSSIQGKRYKHWSYGVDKIERSCVIAATGRQDGLHASCSRTVHFGPPSKDFVDAYAVAVLIQATGMFFSQVDWQMGETWKRVQRIYEKLGQADEWHFADQAEIFGYEPCERTFLPRSLEKIPAWSLICWHPSIRGAQCGDTAIVRPDGFEWLTYSQEWPTIEVQVKGVRLHRPALYCRGLASEWAID